MLTSRRAQGLAVLALPTIVYAGTRVLDAFFLAQAAERQPALSDSPAMHVVETIEASPGYWGVLGNWDGQWYKSIALNGYPDELPVENGSVAQNEWAFYPAYPMLVRLVMLSTGAGFEVAAGVLSLVVGYLAVSLLFVFLVQRLSRTAAVATVVLLCTYPTAPVLQVAYTESLALLLVVLAIWVLNERRYGAYVVLVLLLGLTRPVAIVMLLVVGAHWLALSRGHGLGPHDYRRIGGSVGATLLSAALWPLLGWWVTGDREAFLSTQSAWRLDADATVFTAGTLGRAATGDWALLAVVLPVLSYLTWLALRTRSSAWGPEMSAWLIAYPAYILLVAQPTLSPLRYLMLAAVPWWPWATHAEELRTTARGMRWLVLLAFSSAGVVGQYFWVSEVFAVRVSPLEQPFP